VAISRPLATDAKRLAPIPTRKYFRKSRFATSLGNLGWGDRSCRGVGHWASQKIAFLIPQTVYGQFGQLANCQLANCGTARQAVDYIF